MMADRPRSQLPDDPHYWERLAQEINADAAGPLAAYARRDRGWCGVLVRRASWLVAAAAAAMLLLWLTMPARGSSVAFRWIESSLAPSEVAGTLLGASQPPSVDALMVQFLPPNDRETQR